MTIEEAIGELRHYIASDAYCEAPSNEACEMVIQALSAQQGQPNEPHICDGCIYCVDYPSHEKCHGCARVYPDRYCRKPEQEG